MSMQCCEGVMRVAIQRGHSAGVIPSAFRFVSCCRHPILLPSIFVSPSTSPFIFAPPLPPTSDRIKASTPSSRSARRIHRVNQYARYATHRSGKPAYRPSQKTTLPISLFLLIAGSRPNMISGIWMSYNRWKGSDQ